MGAAAATLKPAEVALVDAPVSAGESGDEAELDTEQPPRSRASSARSANSPGGSEGGSSGETSERMEPGSRPVSGGAGPADLGVKSIWTFANGEPVPEAFMEISAESEPAETVLDNIEAEVVGPSSQPSKQSIDDKLKHVRAIMAEMDADERISMLDAEARETREIRVNVAKRLAKAREAHEKKVQRQELNKRKEFLYQKAKMVELILEKRNKQIKLKKDIQRYEAKEMVAITKLGELKTLLKEREAVHKEACAEWKGKFEPVVACMSHVEDAEGVLRKTALNASSVSLNRDITRELQNLLSKTLEKSSSALYDQRTSLHAIRADIDARLKELRAQNPGLTALNGRPAGSIIKLLHEPGGRLINEISDIEQRMRSNILDFKDRITLIRDEAEWMQHNPSTTAWRDLESKLSSVTNRNEMQEKVENAHAFLSSWLESKAMRRIDEDLAARGRIIKEISDEILGTVVEEFVQGVSQHCVSLTETVDSACMNTIAFAISGSRTRSFPDTLNLVRGHWYASAISSFYDPAKQREVGFAPKFVCCERNPISFPPQEPNIRSKCQREIALKKLLMYPQDTVALENLFAREREALDDLTASPADGTFKLPSSSGELSMLRILPRTAANQSLVVAGTSLGRFAVWTVPWSSGTIQGFPMPARMVAYSPSLPAKEVSPIEDLKESPTSPNLIVTLDKKNCVRVWTLNPPAKRGKHSRAFVCDMKNNFTPYVPACIFLLTPNELNLPLPPEITRFHEKKRPIDAHVGVNPKSICFHPSCNFSGRNQSILIGTEGGDLYKINMDVKEPALVAPIVYMKPFVSVEYPHAVSGEGQIVAQENNTGGNRAYREVFHFHKSPIVFLDVLFRASDTIISIDASGVIATWSYRAENFSGSGWFSPATTTFLDLGFLSHEPLPVKGAPATPDLANYTEKIELPSQEFMDTLKLWRRRRIYMPPGSTYAVLETFFPIIESEKREIQYECMTIVRDSPSENIDNDDRTPRSSSTSASSANEESVFWMKQSMKRCLSGSTIHDISISDDGADIGIVISTMAYPRSSIYATALESKLRGQHVSSSNDNGTSPSECFVGLSLHGVIVTVDSKDILFHQSYTVFELSPGEKIILLSIGPLQPDLSTRIALVRTSSRMRLFCTDSGIEIISESGNFPFLLPDLPLPNRKQKFPRTISAVCPQFSMMAFGNNSNSALNVHILHHSYEGIEKSSSAVQFTDAEKKKLRHRFHFVSKLTAISKKVSIAKDVGEYVVDILLDSVMSTVTDTSRRANIIEAMYGTSDDLGVVLPTTWPYSRDDLNLGTGLPAIFEVPSDDALNESVSAYSNAPSTPLQDSVMAPVQTGDPAVSNLPGAESGQGDKDVDLDSLDVETVPVIPDGDVGASDEINKTSVNNTINAENSGRELDDDDDDDVDTKTDRIGSSPGGNKSAPEADSRSVSEVASNDGLVHKPNSSSRTNSFVGSDINGTPKQQEHQEETTANVE